MKCHKLLVLCLFVTLPSWSFAYEDDCEEGVPIPTGAGELLKTLESVSNGLYKNIATMKVNHDGEGVLSVYYEDGKPKLLKLTYKNGSGTVVKQVTFDDLAAGKPLIYENPDKPGKAIVLEKGPRFNSNHYDFRFKIRSKLKPEEFETYPLQFNPSVDSPVVSYNNKTFKKMVISPGVSMFSWDGTFKKVEFN